MSQDYQFNHPIFGTPTNEQMEEVNQDAILLDIEQSPESLEVLWVAKYHFIVGDWHLSAQELDTYFTVQDTEKLLSYWSNLFELEGKP